MKKKIKLKKILIFISLLMLTINSVFFVRSCSEEQEAVNFDQQIVSAINKIQDYQVDIFLKTPVKKIADLINHTFIKKKLDQKNQRFFDNSRFKFIKFTNAQQNNLLDDELLSVSKIKAKVFINMVVLSFKMLVY